jgi:hypothetical protein
VGLFFGVFLALVQASYEHLLRDSESASKFRHLRDVLRLRKRTSFENASKV